MDDPDRDKLSGRDTEKSDSESGFGTSQSESWRSEPSRKSLESKQESEKGVRVRTSTTIINDGLFSGH